MAKPKKSASEPALNYEAKLWQMADALRNTMDAAECMQVVLGLEIQRLGLTLSHTD